MADNDVKVINENAGKVSSPYAQAFDTGMTLELMRRGQKSVVSLISGTIGADNITGTDGDDIVMSNGALTPEGARIKGNDFIEGRKGNDLAIIPGAREDWIPKVPNVAQYPGSRAQAFWSEHPQQAYGSTLILENKNDGTTVSLRNVEQIVFADKKFDFESGRTARTAEQPQFTPQALAELDEAIKTGTVKTAATKDLFAEAEKGMTDEQKLSARLQSTFKAQEKLAATIPSKMMEDGFEATGNRIAAELKKESGAGDFINKVKAAPLAPTM